MAAEKVHVSLRLDKGLAERIESTREDGETLTAVYAKALEAGVNALQNHEHAVPPHENQADGIEAIKVLRETVAMLKEDKEDLRRQLAEQADAYRKQIDTMASITSEAQTIAKQSQALHAMTETKELGTAEDNEKRRGLLARLFNR